MSSARRLRALLRRFSVHGDYLLLLQKWGLRRCPFFLEPVFLAGYSLLFFLLCRQARSAIVSNLSVVIPGSGPLRNWFRAYVVILNFAASLTDAIRRRNDEDIIEWEIEGLLHLDQLLHDKSGALLLTAHMGNYDLAAALLADRFNRRVHAVRAPERQSEAQTMRRRQLEEGPCPENLMIRYNGPDAMLGVELAKAISDGEIVAIQGDRVLFGVAEINAPFDDSHSLRVPKGPLVLAAITGCRISPVFILRTGYRRYRVIAGPAFGCERKLGPDQDRLLKEAAARWIDVMRPVLQRYWKQWFVFEPAFVRS